MEQSGDTSRVADVVFTHEEARHVPREPLVMQESLDALLDAAGLGAGSSELWPIAGGHSNLTYRIRRAGHDFVLRRPPRGPLHPSAHNVLREAKLLQALRTFDVRVPQVLLVCDDSTIIGAPFYVMDFVDGHVLRHRLPSALRGPGSAEAIARELVDALVELHAIGADQPELAGFGHHVGYLTRQLHRFRGLLEATATRPLPQLERVADWLEAEMPDSPNATVVHGDYRIGNVMYSAASPRLVAILDWELSTIGDPIADLGYLTAMWTRPGDPADPMRELCTVTRGPGFPERHELVARYASETGRHVEAVRWYEVLALWKSAIFLEGSYRRHCAGTSDDPYFARFKTGVPQLADLALEMIWDWR